MNEEASPPTLKLPQNQIPFTSSGLCLFILEQTVKVNAFGQKAREFNLRKISRDNDAQGSREKRGKNAT